MPFFDQVDENGLHLTSLLSLCPASGAKGLLQSSGANGGYAMAFHQIFCFPFPILWESSQLFDFLKTFLHILQKMWYTELYNVRF